MCVLQYSQSGITDCPLFSSLAVQYWLYVQDAAGTPEGDGKPILCVCVCVLGGPPAAIRPLQTISSLVAGCVRHNVHNNGMVNALLHTRTSFFVGSSPDGSKHYIRKWPERAYFVRILAPDGINWHHALQSQDKLAFMHGSGEAAAAALRRQQIKLRQRSPRSLLPL